MAYDTHDEEQAEALKRWWRENGNSVITGVALAVAITLGWQWWQGQREAKAQLAGQIYAQVLAKLDSASNGAAGAIHGSSPSGEAASPGTDPLSAVRAPAEQLLNEFGGTLYAELATLALARVETEAGQQDAARARLKHLIDNGQDDSIKALARLRLTRLLWAGGEPEQALRQLEGDWPEAFRAEADSLRGDVLGAQGKIDEARKAYDSALAQASLMGQETGLIRIKRDDLGGSHAPVPVQP
ncbi:MAG: YfgM family protein [Pseudomonadota bacterium]